MRNIKFINETVTIKDENSSCIDRASYNFKYNTLDVKYKTKNNNYVNYRYWNVSPRKFLEFMESDSAGKYINIIIKPLHKMTKRFINMTVKEPKCIQL